MYAKLMEKIENKTAVLGVVGLGYVGLPLAVEKAKAGYIVKGFDVQKKRWIWSIPAIITSAMWWIAI